LTARRQRTVFLLTAAGPCPIINRVVEYSSPSLDSVFAAVADPTRRAILRQLGKQPARVTDIAKSFPVSLNAVSKHLMVLERAGLIEREVDGREHVCRLNAAPLRKASIWLAETQAFWEQRLDALEKHILEKRKRKR
jgi:DNA-binding transcriptional ArsR family regulator